MSQEPLGTQNIIWKKTWTEGGNERIRDSFGVTFQIALSSKNLKTRSCNFPITKCELQGWAFNIGSRIKPLIKGKVQLLAKSSNGMNSGRYYVLN